MYANLTSIVEELSESFPAQVYIYIYIHMYVCKFDKHSRGVVREFSRAGVYIYICMYVCTYVNLTSSVEELSEGFPTQLCMCMCMQI